MYGLSLSICLGIEIKTAEPRPSWRDYYAALFEYRERNSLHFFFSPLKYPVPLSFLLATRAAVSFIVAT